MRLLWSISGVVMWVLYPLACLVDFIIARARR